MSDNDFKIEVVDGRDALLGVIFRETPEGTVRMDVRGMRVTYSYAADLLLHAATEMKARALAEEATQ